MTVVRHPSLCPSDCSAPAAPDPARHRTVTCAWYAVNRPYTLMLRRRAANGRLADRDTGAIRRGRTGT